jgi:hypothetical protein
MKMNQTTIIIIAAVSVLVIGTIIYYSVAQRKSGFEDEAPAMEEDESSMMTESPMMDEGEEVMVPEDNDDPEAEE